MAVTAKMYGNALLRALNKEIDWDANAANNQVKVVLVNGYTPNQDTHVFYSSVTGQVASSGTYTGPTALTCAAPSYSAKVITLDAGDVSWTGTTISATMAVIFYDTGTAATSPLLGWVDFGGTISSTNGTFSITWDATGIFTITAA